MRGIVKPHERKKDFSVEWRMYIKMNILEFWTLDRPSALTQSFKVVADTLKIRTVV